MYKDIDSARFNEIVNLKENAILLFYAEIAVPSMTLLARLEDVTNEIFKVDVEVNWDIARLCEINALPTMLYFKAGKNVSFRGGLLTLDDFEKWIAIF